MRVDCGPVRIATWEELERYMQGSVGAVGRILAVLLGAPPERARAFTRLALAFQLTNFIRDVREDWELDRVYLPARGPRALRRLAGRDRRPRAEPGFRRLLALEVERARDLFRGAAAADEVVPRRRPGDARLASCVYMGVLDRARAARVRRPAPPRARCRRGSWGVAWPPVCPRRRDAPGHAARRRAHPDGGATRRRPGVRRQLRRAGRGARAGGQRSRRAARGPLRGRRARHLGLRRPPRPGSRPWGCRPRSARRSRT